MRLTVITSVVCLPDGGGWVKVIDMFLGFGGSVKSRVFLLNDMICLVRRTGALGRSSLRGRWAKSVLGSFGPVAGRLI